MESLTMNIAKYINEEVSWLHWYMYSAIDSDMQDIDKWLNIELATIAQARFNRVNENHIKKQAEENYNPPKLQEIWEVSTADS